MSGGVEHRVLKYIGGGFRKRYNITFRTPIKREMDPIKNYRFFSNFGRYYKKTKILYVPEKVFVLELPKIDEKLKFDEKKYIALDKNGKKYKLIEDGSNWQIQHLKSLQSAYRNSPFFEFYIDDLMPVFNKKYTYLLDVNIDTFLVLNKALEMNPTFSKSLEYVATSKKNDFRFLSEVKKHPTIQVEKYTQMFDDKHGFISNLSV